MPVTRRVFISPSTCKPDAEWMRENTRAFFRYTEETGLSVKIVMRDRDGKFANGFDDIVKSSDAERTPLVSIRSSFGPPGGTIIRPPPLSESPELSQSLSRYVDYYHEERPHQGLDNRLLLERPPPDDSDSTVPLGQIECRKRLGGVLKSYRRVAA